MPIFSYQSFNASSSTEHDLRALTNQHFAVMAHDCWADANGDEPKSLVYPTALTDAVQRDKPAEGPANLVWPQGSPSAILVPPVVTSPGIPPWRHEKPVQGPANLVKTEPKKTLSGGNVTPAQMNASLHMMQQKVLQNRQAVYRQLQAMPDVTAYGELDTAHADFATMPGFAGPRVVGSSSNDMCNQNFSIFSNNICNAKRIADGVGWYAVTYLGYNVVFVHVPNDTAKKPKTAVVEFYKNIQYEILRNGGGIIDLVMGDTNQTSDKHTPNALNQATGYNFVNAHNHHNIAPADLHNVIVNGTNSTRTKMYDVAVYNADTVKLKQGCYWTQLAPYGNAGKVAAVTDHMGLAVEIEKL